MALNYSHRLAEISKRSATTPCVVLPPLSMQPDRMRTQGGDVWRRIGRFNQYCQIPVFQNSLNFINKPSV